MTVGLDANSENNWALYPRETRGTSPTYYGSNGLGNKSVTRTTQNFLTLDYAGNVKYNLRSSYDFTTTFGLQHYRAEASSITATRQHLPGGADHDGVRRPRRATAPKTTRPTRRSACTCQQQMGWQNRLFFTAALRGDDNSTFGKDYSAAYYPKVSASWVVSEEPFWTDKLSSLSRVFDNLRLRVAYGAAGAQPGTFDAQRLYAPSTGYQDTPGLVPSSFGNPDLKPERSAELEPASSQPCSTA